MERASASAVYGHSVRNENLACTGCNGRFSAYAVEPSKLVVLDTRDTREAHGSLGSQSVHQVAQPIVEVISCVAMHPHEDVLCVGTANHGLYLTRASAPELSAQTRLPFSVTGEHLFSACFTSLSPTSTVLIFSSTFHEKKGPLPHRLSLWHLEERQLLWRGAMEPLTRLCNLSTDGAFAACAGPRVYLFTAQSSSSLGGAGDEQGEASPTRAPATPTRQRVVVLSRQCTSVPQLEGVEYVQCLCAPGRAEDGNEVYALTSSGYVVAFDVATGAVARWMDCKVCPATSMRLWGDCLVLTGSLVRFFRADSWKFCGKMRVTTETGTSTPALEEVLGDGLVSTFVSVRADDRHLLFFSRGGGYALYRCDAPFVDGDDHHVTVERLGQFAPMLLSKSALLSASSSAASPYLSAQWLLSAAAMVVWTRGALAALQPSTRTSLNLPERTNCAVYHDRARCVLAFMTAQSQWMAFDIPALEAGQAVTNSDASLWHPCGALSWSSDTDGEPLHVTVSPTTADVAVLSGGNTVTTLTCTRALAPSSASSSSSGASSVLLQRGKVQRAQCGAPLTKLLYVADRLYGVTAQSIVFLGSAHTRLATDLVKEEFPIKEDIVDACGTSRDVAVVHTRGAYLYRTDRTGRCASVPVPDAIALGHLPLRMCSYEPSTDCLALANDAQVLLYRSLPQVSAPQQTVTFQPATPERLDGALTLPWIRAMGVQAVPGTTPGFVRVYVLNSLGQVARYDTVLEAATALSSSPPASLNASTAARGVEARMKREAPAPSTASRLLPARTGGDGGGGGGGERPSPGRPPLRAVSRGEAPAGAARRARRSTSAAAPTSGELQDRFDELNGFYAHQKQLDALTPRAGRRGSARHGEGEAMTASTAGAAAMAAARSASAPSRAAYPTAHDRGTTDSPSPSGSPPRPVPFDSASATAPRAPSLSAVEVSAMSNASAVATPLARRTDAADSVCMEGGVADLSGPNIPLPDEDWATGAGGWHRDPAAHMTSPSRRPPVPIFGRDEDASVGSDVSTAATTFSIRARTLRQSLVDLQELLDEGQLPEEVNTSDDITALTHLLASVAASLQTLHQNGAH